MQYTDIELQRRIDRLFSRKAAAIKLLLEHGYLDFAMELYASLIDQVAHLYIIVSKITGTEYQQAAQEIFDVSKNHAEILWSVRNGLLHAGSSQADHKQSKRGQGTFITSKHTASENVSRFSFNEMNHPAWIWNIENISNDVLKAKDRFIAKTGSSNDIREHFRKRAERLIYVKSNSEMAPDDIFESSLKK